MAWVRLDIDYMDDPKIWEAGWETAALWPAVLVLLKANDGVLDDQLLSPRYLARKMDCPREVAEAAIDGVKRTGLLTFGTISWKVHKGNVASREGWYSPRWVEHGNAPNSWTVGEIAGRDSSANLAEGSDTLPKVAEGSETLPKVSDTLPNDSRARCGSVGGSVGSVSDQEDARPSPVDLVWASWRESNPSARKAPTSGQRKTIKARLQDHSPEALADYFRWLRESHHKRATFCRQEGHDGFTSVMRPTNVDERMPWVQEWASGGGDGTTNPEVDRWWREVDGHAQKARNDIPMLRVVGQIQTFDQALDYIARQEGAPPVQAIRPIVARWWEDQP